MEVDNNDQKIENYLVKKSFSLYKNKKNEFLDIYNSPINNDKFQKNFELKFIFDKENNNHYFKYKTEKKNKKKIWVYKKNNYLDKLEKIKKNNIIKLGALEFYFEKIELHNKEKKLETKNEKKELNKSLNMSYCSKNITCRICLEEETEKNEFEKNLCLCSKKMPAHITCIKKWITNSFKSINEKIIFFEFKKIKCKICNTEYSDQNKQILLDTKEIEKKFINFVKIKIINTITKKVKGILYIYLPLEKKNEKIKIGTGYENDIILKSGEKISENHCSFVIKDESIYLKDNYSRFGSFFLLDDKFYLEDIINDFIIIDRFSFHFFMDFKFRPEFLCIKRCLGNKIENEVNKYKNYTTDIKNNKENKNLVDVSFEKKQFKDDLNSLEDKENFGNVNLIESFPYLMKSLIVKKKKKFKSKSVKKKLFSNENKMIN